MRMYLGKDALSMLSWTDHKTVMVEGIEPESIKRVIELAEPLVNDLTIWTREDDSEISIFFC